MSALAASHLTKIIGAKTIVDDVSFELRPGEVFGFLGPNGAGKTTTIRMLVGLIKPTRGTVTVCGFDIRRDFEKALRCIGCIVENPDLYRFMTGRENLEHFARMLDVPAREIDRVASLVNLSHRLDQRVGTYSLGMRQRLGIAQAMLG
ncbi:MAG TPA: ABC transporter ATP-binding protein, partial [Thermoanaerobaculia bacterium]|nr:ABC transporter ATP-binding protein [Thermoanaerobaculia bacterium]